MRNAATMLFQSSWAVRLILMVAVSAIGILPNRSVAADDVMSFRNECFANYAESCFVIAEGKLDPDAPRRFEELVSAGIDGDQVLLNSPGGGLSAGLKLGRAIRARELGTVIGRWDDSVSFEEMVDAGKCLSACAYSFLGGLTRTMAEGGQIGFHQFALPGGDILQGPGGLSEGQKISALLVSYIAEMGIDARLFTRASGAASDTMFFPTRDELVEFEVITPTGFDHFVLEPYEDGIIALSKRLDAPGLYDLVARLTAFCQGGFAHFRLTAPPPHGLPADTIEAGVQFSSSNVAPISVTPDRVSTWSTSDGGFIELLLFYDEVEKLYQASQMTVFFQTSRASGGTYRASVELNEMDKRMLAAAFRFCI